MGKAAMTTLLMALLLTACGGDPVGRDSATGTPVKAASAPKEKGRVKPAPKPMTAEQVRQQRAPTAAETKSVQDVMRAIAALPEGTRRDGVFVLTMCRMQSSSDRDPFARSEEFVREAAADISKDPKAGERCSPAASTK